MAEAGYGNILIPPIPSRASQDNTFIVGGEREAVDPQPPLLAEPTPLSRENSYQDSSEPPSQPGTPQAIRRKSRYPEGPISENSSAADLVTLKADMMCSWLHQQQIEKGLVLRIALTKVVMLKKARDDYMCCPKQLQTEGNGLLEAVSKLNVKVRAIQTNWHE